ncbi:hypothetical protein KKE85_03075, partial [Patescibacteria group bacterium]|nr:hypothetical protein [Patescibacteria group bacterium]
MVNKKNSSNHSSRFTMEKVIPQSWKEKAKQWLKNPQTRGLLTVAFLFFSTIIVVLMVQGTYRFFSKAAPDKVGLSFVPQTASVTPTGPQQLKLWLTPTKALGFINVEVNFDKTLLKLNQAVSILDTKYSQVIKLSTPDEANADGKIIITLGLDPNQLNAVTAQAFALANLSFIANTANPNLTSNVTFNTTNAQLVATDTAVLTPTAINAILSINVTTGAKLYFSAPVPANPQTIQQNFKINVLADTANKDVTGVDTKITFDIKKLQIVKIDAVANNGFKSYPVKVFDNATGVVQISANIGAGVTALAVKGSNIAV